MSQNYLYRYVTVCKSTVNKLCTVMLTSIFVCRQMYGCVILDNIAFTLDVFWGGSVNICTELQVILLFSCVELLYAVRLLTGYHVCSTLCSMCIKTKLLRKDKWSSEILLVSLIDFSQLTFIHPSNLIMQWLLHMMKCMIFALP